VKSTTTPILLAPRSVQRLRQDPDVVLIGEMRDLETIAAITIAETGHLVFATLHTNSAAQSIDRMIDVFPPHQQPQIRAQLPTS
jgi:twitching motility protein PilT